MANGREHARGCADADPSTDPRTPDRHSARLTPAANADPAGVGRRASPLPARQAFRVGRRARSRAVPRYPYAEKALATNASSGRASSVVASCLQAVCGAVVLWPKRQATAVSLMVTKSAIWAPYWMGRPLMVMSPTVKFLSAGTS